MSYYEKISKKSTPEVSKIKNFSCMCNREEKTKLKSTIKNILTCPESCKCPSLNIWDGAGPPKPNCDWVTNFNALRRSWSDHAKRHSKLNSFSTKKCLSPSEAQKRNNFDDLLSIICSNQVSKVSDFDENKFLKYRRSNATTDYSSKPFNSSITNTKNSITHQDLSLKNKINGKYSQEPENRSPRVSILPSEYSKTSCKLSKKEDLEKLIIKRCLEVGSMEQSESPLEIIQTEIKDEPFVSNVDENEQLFHEEQNELDILPENISIKNEIDDGDDVENISEIIKTAVEDQSFINNDDEAEKLENKELVENESSTNFEKENKEIEEPLTRLSGQSFSKESISGVFNCTIETIPDC